MGSRRIRHNLATEQQCHSKSVPFCKKLPNVFQRGCATLHPHQQPTRVPLAPHLPQPLLSVFWILAVLINVCFNSQFPWMTYHAEHKILLFHINMKILRMNLETCFFISAFYKSRNLEVACGSPDLQWTLYPHQSPCRRCSGNQC